MADQQWEQDRPKAYHIRRRLTRDEQALVGDAVDLRGTPEALERFERMRRMMPGPVLEMASQEIVK